jgi:hypothetical protein
MNTRHSPQQAGESPRSPMASLSVLVRRFCYRRLARHRRDMHLDSTRGLHRDVTATFWRAAQITAHSTLVFLNEWGHSGSVLLRQKAVLWIGNRTTKVTSQIDVTTYASDSIRHEGSNAMDTIAILQTKRTRGFHLRS